MAAEVVLREILGLRDRAREEATAERLGRPASRIDYVLPSQTSGEVTWGAYFKGGAIFLANERGKITRRIS